VTTHFIGSLSTLSDEIGAFTTADAVLSDSNLLKADVFSDPQTRAVAATWSRLSTTSNAVWFTEDAGTTWQTFAGPPTFTPLWLAVIVRGG
jgi:hypothetical protein